MCYSPYFVKRREVIVNGELKVRHSFISFEKYKGEKYDYTFPCGKCVECQIEKSNEWAYRIMAEASDYDKNCFITLTYEDNPKSLIKRDYQLFLKRLRKKIGSFRYFLSGEYGSKRGRPHFHLIIFGWFPQDAFLINKKKKYYGSEFLADIWGKGFVSVGELDFDDAKYCAKYLQKSQDLFSFQTPPFIQASLKPGLGFNYFMKNKENLLKTDKLVFRGKFISLPRYFIKLMMRELNTENISKFNELRLNRKKKAELLYRNNDITSLNIRAKKYEKKLLH